MKMYDIHSDFAGDVFILEYLRDVKASFLFDH